MTESDEADLRARLAAAEAKVRERERRKLPDEREGRTHKFKVGDQKGYLTVGIYPHDPACGPVLTGQVCASGCRHGRPGEIFISMAKPPKTEGRDIGSDAYDQTWSMLRGFTEAVAVNVSMRLQRGESLWEIADKHRGANFAPSGFTGNPEIPRATSILDYVFRWLLLQFHREEYLKQFGRPEGSEP